MSFAVIFYKVFFSFAYGRVAEPLINNTACIALETFFTALERSFSVGLFGSTANSNSFVSSPGYSPKLSPYVLTVLTRP